VVATGLERGADRTVPDDGNELPDPAVCEPRLQLLDQRCNCLDAGLVLGDEAIEPAEVTVQVGQGPVWSRRTWLCVAATVV